ncbi:hypothetical protein VTJ04DRAFT_4077 [Mycothermus thermophilus]|uniref:uncharacterized protein n=1 Tax=Humicola insolens TaxID=85995 RepID=UPI00374350F6
MDTQNITHRLAEQEGGMYQDRDGRMGKIHLGVGCFCLWRGQFCFSFLKSSCARGEAHLVPSAVVVFDEAEDEMWLMDGWMDGWIPFCLLFITALLVWGRLGKHGKRQTERGWMVDYARIPLIHATPTLPCVTGPRDRPLSSLLRRFAVTTSHDCIFTGNFRSQQYFTLSRTIRGPTPTRQSSSAAPSSS